MSGMTPEDRRFLRDVAEQTADQHRHPFEPSDVLALLNMVDRLEVEVDRLADEYERRTTNLQRHPEACRAYYLAATDLRAVVAPIKDGAA